MVGKEPDIGPTARTVANNLNRLRADQKMNYTELSERLEARAGWTINAVGIRRIESGERRVTPDDLVALALALGVSPVTLLMPETADRDEPVVATGLEKAWPAEDLWKWLRGDGPLSAKRDFDELIDFMQRAVPAWRRQEWTEGVAKIIELNIQELDRQSDGDN
ncbi:MAG: helix-turn-helix transcriptional regulator [Mycobacterium sp.]|jgi:transcriptional regulator with XRE-family HTH domain|nr:helix-turn-helix transcriptional regulator [Mycobacterium sp.]